MAAGDWVPETIALETNGLSFEALAAGPRGGELILALHGFPQFAESWAEVMRSLADAGYRVVAVNQRGYSKDARPSGVSDYALGELVSDTLGFADALHAPRFHLLGHDWGGAVAWAVAAAHPRRLYSLSVLCTPHLDAFREALKTDLKQKALSLYLLLFRAPLHAAEKVLLAGNALLLRGAYGGKVPAAQVEANVRRLREDGTLTAALNWYRATSFSSGEIGPVRVPTTYIWGDLDQALGEVAALATANYVFGSYRFQRLQGKSHWLLEECPGEVSRLVLARVKASNGPV